MSADFQSSNNPFRRKGNTGVPALTPNPTAPAHPTVFGPEPAANSRPEGPPADADPAPKRKTKVVKRVRVQTPPPLSSDSESDSPAGTESPGGRGWGEQDPFGGAREDDSPAEAGPPRRNPFSKTLHDIEPARNHEAKPSTKAGRASLDVAAFSRLLLTGQPGANSSAPPPGATSPHTPSPDTGSESSSPLPGRAAEPAPSDASPLLHEPVPAPKKKPPPPSSRHGRAIRLQLGGEEQPPPLTRTPSDFNKPLPPAPLRSPEEEEAESVFDREAAGRVPEGPPSPAASVEGRKGTPAPPPRRGRHDEGRGGGHEVQRRGSMESTHSRAESIRQAAPAPPPPRRPAHRSTSSITSPSSQSFSTPAAPYTAPDAGPTSPRAAAAQDASSVKLAPPPPPARNASTRRRANNSVDGGRRAKEGAPRPPPPRQRGGSRGSLESLTEERRGHGQGEVGVAREEGDGQAGVILADLDALRREVDALQKQYASAQRGD